MIQITSKSDKETKNFAKKLAKNAFKLSGTVVFSLEGELGAGKTTFTQGFAQGLKIKEKIQSPTFVILKIYKIGSRKKLIHVDAYRLQAKDFKVFCWKKFVNPPAGGPQNIILVEWGNKIKNILPKNTIRIIFKHGKKSNERILVIHQLF